MTTVKKMCLKHATASGEPSRKGLKRNVITKEIHLRPTHIWKEVHCRALDREYHQRSSKCVGL